MQILREPNYQIDKKSFNQLMISTILIVLLLGNYIINSSIYSWAVLAYAVFMAIIVEPIYFIVPCLLVDTIEGCFLVTSSLTFSLALSVLFFICFLIHGNTKIKIDNIDILFIIFGVYNFATCIWSLTGSYTDGISMIINVFMIIALRQIKTDNIDGLYKQLAFTAYAYILVLAVLLFGNVRGALNVTRVSFDDEINVNTIAGAIALMACIIWGITNFKTSKTKILSYAFIAISAITILYTGSRTALFAMILTIVLLPIFLGRISGNGMKLRTIMLFILVTIVLVAAIEFMMSNNTAVFSRFTFQGRSMIGVDRRYSIWMALIQHIIPNHFLFGIGLGHSNVRYAVTPYVIFPNHAHNMLLGIIAETGLIGLILNILCYVTSIKVMAKNYNKYTAVILAILLFGFSRGIGEVIINTHWFFIGIGLIFLTCNNANDQTQFQRH